MGGTDDEQPQDALPHAYEAYSEWLALQDRVRAHNPVVVNGRSLTIADVVAVSLLGASADLSNDPLDLQLVHNSVAFLACEVEAGRVIYGVNTGFGGSADTRTQHVELLQSSAIQHLNVGILLGTDKEDPAPSSGSAANSLLRSHALPTPVVKGAMLIRCNSLMRGHSGVRVSVIESVMKLLSLDMTPVVPLRGTISASGDLMPLSYIAGALEGNPDIFVKVGGGRSCGKPRVLPASEALKLAGLGPVRLQAKEGLGLTNGTAPSCAAACLAIHQANQLALLTQLLTAMGTEALDGTANNYHPFISAVRPHPGQAEAAANIRRFLAGSKISPPTTTPSAARVGLAQDRYALRTAPQWIGPQLEDLLLATRQVATELNSTTDNPLLDPAGARIHHGGNFQAHALTSAAEKTMLALQNLGRLLFAQSSELINHATSKGLPPNLAWGDPSASFTCKGFDVNMAAYAAELAYLARPVSAHVQVAEMANQSVNSMALVAARYALEAAEVVCLMAATHVFVLCQALDLRCLQLEFGGRVAGAVAEVARRCLLQRDKPADGEEEQAKEDAAASAADGIEVKIQDAILARWDGLSQLDLPDRCAAAVRESLGAVLECLAGREVSVGQVREFQAQMAAALETCYGDLRAEFVRRPTTTEYISPASRVVYDFVRKELRIPLNRGVEDHPPLLQRKRAAGKAGANGECKSQGARGAGGSTGDAEDDEERVLRSRTLGTMASEIYEALRRGELHDRIMRFGEEAGIWGCR